MALNNFEVIAKIMAATLVCERERKADSTLFDTKVLGTDEKTRDWLVVELQEAGYIKGFKIIDDIYGGKYPVVLYELSEAPRVTIDGLTFMAENKHMKNAIATLKAITSAANRLSNAIYWWC